MPTVVLTDRTIRSLEPPTKGQTTFWDQGQSGFGVRVSSGGARSFVLMYGANRTRKTIGRYPAVSLKQARDKAKELLAEFTLGLERHRSISWTEAKERFIQDCERKNKPNTVAYYRKRLDKHFKFGQRNLSDISKQEVLQRIRKISTSASEQHHAFVAARTLFNWAVREDLISASPLQGVGGFKPAKARERVLNEDELRSVWLEAKRAPYPYGPLIQVLILTGLRRTEAASLEWGFIDEVEGVVTIPAHLTKNGRTHSIPLSGKLSQVFADLPGINKYLFPSAHEKAMVFNGWGKSKARFDAQLEGVEPYTLHDLRRTFATMHAKIGTPIHVTEKLLNHVSGTISGVAAIYNRHTYLEEMQTASKVYDEHLAKLVENC